MKLTDWIKKRISKPECSEMITESIKIDRERGIEMRFRHPMFAKLMEEIVDFFMVHGGQNFVEFTVCNTHKYEAYTVTVQKENGETPGAQCERLRKRIAELEANPSPPR